jgi:hypothetical protein
MLLYVLVLIIVLTQCVWSLKFAGVSSLIGKSGMTTSSLFCANELHISGAHEAGGAQILVIAPEAADSPFKTKPFEEPVKWVDVLSHVADRATWESKNGRFDATHGDLVFKVMTTEELRDDLDSAVAVAAPILVLAGLQAPGQAQLIESLLLAKKTAGYAPEAIATVDCSNDVQRLERYGSYAGDGTETGLLASLTDKIGETSGAKWFSNKTARNLIRMLWQRQSIEDTLFAMLILVNEFTPYFVKSVQEATSTSNTGLKELKCMCTKCSKEMIDCFGNPECRKALDCLNACQANDQVCSYKCITSYETVDFERFSQCILQRNNCMGLSATVPVYPNPSPMASFRGKALDHETAEEILIGHLRPRKEEEGEGEGLRLLPPSAPREQWSWKVVCGVNPAYDYFSDQHQIFYRDKDRRSVMWYDPTFKVVTLDENEVWRRRHYRVRRRKDSGPGTFQFTVLDNGVLSDEWWRVLDAADDLSWTVLYYSGAASAAGTAYSGALVCTRDGKWPAAMMDNDLQKKEDDPVYQRISAALKRGGVEMYELFEVKQTPDAPGNLPPLGTNRDDM